MVADRSAFPSAASSGEPGPLYGWRAKLGLIIPSNNTVIEPEMWAMRPPGVTVHSARVLSYGNTPEGIVRMETSAMRAAAELGAGAMSAVAYACLATSLVKGPSWNADIAVRIRDQCRIPATTAATATLEALRAVSARSIGIANAYPERLNTLVTRYMEAEGFSVGALESLGVENSLELWRLAPDTIHDLGRRVASHGPIDALAIIATDLPTISVIRKLEDELGIPVITTNQAVLWHCLKLTSTEASIPGYGRLLARVTD